jgi:hypothetical protein
MHLRTFALSGMVQPAPWQALRFGSAESRTPLGTRVTSGVVCALCRNALALLLFGQVVPAVA